MTTWATTSFHTISYSTTFVTYTRKGITHCWIIKDPSQFSTRITRFSQVCVRFYLIIPIVTIDLAATIVDIHVMTKQHYDGQINWKNALCTLKQMGKTSTSTHRSPLMLFPSFNFAMTRPPIHASLWVNTQSNSQRVCSSWNDLPTQHPPVSIPFSSDPLILKKWGSHTFLPWVTLRADPTLKRCWVL